MEPKGKTLIARVRGWIRPWTGGAEPMEVHRAVLEDVESRVVAAGGGRKLFPYGRVRIRLLASGEEERAVLEALARDAWDLPGEVRARLAAAGARCQEELEVTVTVTGETGPEFGERRFAVAYERGEAVPPAAPEATAPRSRPTLVLTVLAGEATQRVYTPAGDRVHVGRLPEILDADGRVRRRNDVAFSEEGEVNQTVSREHARIAWEPEEASWWLRDEGSAYGTRVFRAGRAIEVSAHDRRGVRLQHGDELSFGRARVKVALREE